MRRVFDTPIISNDQSIDRVLGAGLPVVLVFLDGKASIALESSMNAAARQHAGSLLVVSMPKRDSTATSRKFGVSRFPALVTISGSQAQSQGEDITASDFEKHVAYVLGRGPKPVSTPRNGHTEGAQAQSAQPGSSSDLQPRAVSDATFEQEVMRSPVPVVVDFWAPWCGPCRMVAPTLDKLAREYGGRVRIAKVNVDENPNISMQYNIRSIPTMMVVKDGHIVDQWVGALPEPSLRSRVAGIVGK